MKAVMYAPYVQIGSTCDDKVCIYPPRYTEPICTLRSFKRDTFVYRLGMKYYSFLIFA